MTVTPGLPRHHRPVDHGGQPLVEQPRRHLDRCEPHGTADWSLIYGYIAAPQRVHSKAGAVRRGFVGPQSFAATLTIKTAVTAVVVEDRLAGARGDGHDPAKDDGVAVALDDFLDLAVDRGQCPAQC